MGKIEGVEFGNFYLKDSTRPYIDYEHPEKHVFTEASAHGCPQPTSVVKDFGAEWTLERYVSCDVVMEKLVLETAERLNLDLYHQLTTPVPREPDEPVGVFEEGRVPNSHLTEMSPASTSYGYSLPRVVIAALGRNENGRIAINHDRLPAMMNTIEESITVSKDPYELLARIAEGSAVFADKMELLSHMFCQGIVREENCVSQYKKIETALEKFAPTLWSTYRQMGPAEKVNNDMWV